MVWSWRERQTNTTKHAVSAFAIASISSLAQYSIIHSRFLSVWGMPWWCGMAAAVCVSCEKDSIIIIFFILFTKRRNFFSLSVWGIFNDLIGIWAAWTWIERINSNGNSNNNNNTDIHTNSNSIHITYATHFDFLYGGYDVF